MRTLSKSLILICVVALTGGAAAPDIIPVGVRHLKKDIRVDPGDLVKTHFVFVHDGGKIVELKKETRMRSRRRGGLWRVQGPRYVYAVPLAKKDALIKALEKTKRVLFPRPTRGADKKNDPLANIPRSEILEERDYVSDGSPIHSVKVRYKVVGINKGKVVLTTERKVFDRNDKELTPEKLKKAKRSYTALMGLVGAMGVVGLALVANRRKTPSR